jgi:hypothetical protein
MGFSSITSTDIPLDMLEYPFGPLYGLVLLTGRCRGEWVNSALPQPTELAPVQRH